MSSKRRSKKKRTEQLAQLSVDEFMATIPSSEEDENEGVPERKLVETKRTKTRHKDQLGRLRETDPEFFQFLKENDHQLLDFSDSEEGSPQEPDESAPSEDEEEGEEAETEKEEEDETDEEVAEETADKCYQAEGVAVTMAMVHKWTDQVKQKHSLQALSQLTTALHCGVVSMLTTTEGGKRERLSYTIRESSVFNALVVACLRHFCQTLIHHVPTNLSTQPISRQTLPSSHHSWKHVRGLVKPYLHDTLQLLSGVAEVTMVCSLLRHVSGLWPFFACFPKLFRRLEQELVRVWSEGDEEPRVLAFLMLRKIAISMGEQRLEEMMRKMHLNYVRHSRLTTLSSLPVIVFMRNCMVEMLGLSPTLSYQLMFVYTRQLAHQLRAAYSAGGGKVKVGTWPFLHSLELFVACLCEIPGKTLRPLLFPIAQVLLGMAQLLCSAQFSPLRLHVVRLLVELVDKTGVFIPIAPLLLEILESHSGHVSRKMVTGKPPDLMCTIKLSKVQIGTRATQAAVLNSALDLLVRMLASTSHTISFPEFSFPITTRLRKIMKNSPLSWFRQHIKTIVEKTEETGSAITCIRSSLSFSPRDQDKILLWEQENKLRPSPLAKFLDKWQEIQCRNAALGKEEQGVQPKSMERKRKREVKEGAVKSKRKRKGVGSHATAISVGKKFEEDTVEDLVLSSDEDQL